MGTRSGYARSIPPNRHRCHCGLDCSPCSKGRAISTAMGLQGRSIGRGSTSGLQPPEGPRTTRSGTSSFVSGPRRVPGTTRQQPLGATKDFRQPVRFYGVGPLQCAWHDGAVSAPLHRSRDARGAASPAPPVAPGRPRAGRSAHRRSTGIGPRGRRARPGAPGRSTVARAGSG